MAASPDLLDPATVAGIHCITVPTTFPVGPVNCYLLEGDPLTLVDCGPSSAPGMLALERGLQAIGHSIADIEQLFITHQHIDHEGLASIVAERSGAQVVALGLLAPFLRDFDRETAADDEHTARLLVHYGWEDRVVKALRWSSKLIQGWGAPVRVDRTVEDGDRLRAGGRDLLVGYRPGHSPSDTILVDTENHILLAGDHLLDAISSNALLSRPLGAHAGEERRKPLVEYRESLLATRELDVSLTLGGHRAPIPDHHALIDGRLRDQERRADQMLGLLGDGPRTPNELATTIWGDVAITQAFMTLSEVVGHLDLLIADGAVAETADGRFATT